VIASAGNAMERRGDATAHAEMLVLRRAARVVGGWRLDGVSVYACTSPDEVVDLLQGGQGVFGIALGRVWQEVEGSLADLPAERARAGADDGSVPGSSAPSADELARRRARKTG